MCRMCLDNDGEMFACPYCGILICWDVKGSDDVIASAAATASGDLNCIDCARRHDAEEEQANEDYWEGDDYWDEEFETEEGGRL